MVVHIIMVLVLMQVNNNYDAVGHCFLDSPNTTSEITYKLYFRIVVVHILCTLIEELMNDLFRGSTSLICMEIKG